MSQKKKKKRVRKFKKKTILFSFFFIITICLIGYYLSKIKITNIYIIGNEYITDYDIIKISKLENYPYSIKNKSRTIENRLKKNDYILDAKVKKKNLFQEVYIYVTENTPLFYNQNTNKYVLKDGSEVSNIYNVPILINEVDSSVYKKFLKKMCDIDSNIFVRISEIKYDPNDIDKERFLLTMNDGNYVYLTLNKFKKINNYLDIVKTFNDSKGILYLDSGEYFELFNNDDV